MLQRQAFLQRLTRQVSLLRAITRTVKWSSPCTALGLLAKSSTNTCSLVPPHPRVSHPAVEPHDTVQVPPSD